MTTHHKELRQCTFTTSMEFSSSGASDTMPLPLAGCPGMGRILELWGAGGGAGSFYVTGHKLFTGQRDSGMVHQTLFFCALVYLAKGGVGVGVGFRAGPPPIHTQCYTHH